MIQRYKQYATQSCKAMLLGVGVFALFLFLPSLVKTSYAEAGEGARCTARGGVGGTCYSRDRVSCGTFYDQGPYCPGDDSVQCCVDNHDYCNPPQGAGVCHNSSMAPSWLSGGSNNGNIYACSGTWVAGPYCLGQSDVQCCVEAPPQTPPPPTNVTASCSTSGTTFTVNWTQVSGQPYYYARIHDETVNSQGSYSGVITGSSYAMTNATPGHRYSYWVHTTNAVGSPWSSEVPTAHGASVTCPIPELLGQSTTTPGIIYSGDGTANFGKGRSSSKEWLVGGALYSEVYKTTTYPSTTSYQYLVNKANASNITITNMTTLAGCSNLANCTLPPTATLPSGVYQANGNVTLNAYTFSGNKNYVFLINGTLTINGEIAVAKGSTAFFSASNDIVIDRNVGTNGPFTPLPSGQIQGLFSADHNITIDGIQNCVTGADKMLNVEGALITNAYGTGGDLRNRRDLCGNNPNYPSLTVRLRLDFLLNAPILLMSQNMTFNEEAP